MRQELIAAGCSVEVAGPESPDDVEGDASGSVADELSALARLHEAGSLSAEEFAAAKARVLGE